MASNRAYKTPTRRFRGNFKSPFQTPVGQGSNKTTDTESIRKEVERLEEENKKLDKEIKQLQTEGYKECELKCHIEKLHEYNDIKDAGQLILGRIANLEGLTTRMLYEKYGLKEDD